LYQGDHSDTGKHSNYKSNDNISIVTNWSHISLGLQVKCLALLPVLINIGLYGQISVKIVSA